MKFRDFLLFDNMLNKSHICIYKNFYDMLVVDIEKGKNNNDRKFFL